MEIKQLGNQKVTVLKLSDTELIWARCLNSTLAMQFPIFVLMEKNYMHLDIASINFIDNS